MIFIFLSRMLKSLSGNPNHHRIIGLCQIIHILSEDIASRKLLSISAEAYAASRVIVAHRGNKDRHGSLHATKNLPGNTITD
jgi:hypothetical protein